jgi:predicted unusual protein kinase regulating ubiquinone biosynthesis (AarF/ABC1/UbiB family)
MISLIYFFWSIYLLTYSETKSRIDRVSKSANKCGPLGIKLLQFILMRKIFKTKELDHFLEHCTTHSFDKTKELYLLDFGRSIDTDFKIESSEPIGSGSIGQVYKFYDIHNNRYVAVKSKHPDIHKQIHSFSGYIRILLKIFYQWKWKYMIEEYIENINIQLDYLVEATNTTKLKNKFKNEDTIIIPSVYGCSENFIIMEYISGKHFNDIPHKCLTSLYFQYIFSLSVLCYDCLHGDLHYGNWKVTPDNKIILYDCSILYESGDLSFNKSIMYYVFNGNYKNMLLMLNPGKDKLIEKVIKEIDKLDNETAAQRIQNFLLKSIEYKLLCDKYLINLLNCVGMIGETKKLSIDIYTKYIFTKGDSNAVMLYTHIDILNKINKFKELKIFFENWMESDPANKTTHLEWLDSNFGHTDSTIISDIIYEKINN